MDANMVFPIDLEVFHVKFDFSFVFWFCIFHERIGLLIIFIFIVADSRILFIVN